LVYLPTSLGGVSKIKKVTKITIKGLNGYFTQKHQLQKPKEKTEKKLFNQNKSCSLTPQSYRCLTNFKKFQIECCISNTCQITQNLKWTLTRLTKE